MALDVSSLIGEPAYSEAVALDLELHSHVGEFYLTPIIDISAEGQGICLVRAFDQQGMPMQAEELGLTFSKIYQAPYFYVKNGHGVSRAFFSAERISRLHLTFFDRTKTKFYFRGIKVTPHQLSDADLDEIKEFSLDPNLGEADEPRLEGFTRPSRLVARKNEALVESLHQVDHRFNYLQKFDLRSLDGESIEDKAALLQPRVYDERMRPIEEWEEPWGRSDRYGAYRYIHGKEGSENSRLFSVPEGAVYYGWTLRNWDAEQDIFFEEQFERVGMKHAHQVDKISNELDNFLANARPEKTLLIYTGTTRIGEKNRANRSMMMANLMAERGWCVVYVYYRFDKRISILEDQAPTAPDSGAVIQIPNDLFQNFAHRIAEFGAGSGAALLSIPDSASVPLCNNLNAMGWRTIYEARDDWEEFARAGAARWYHVAIERALSRTADITVAVSPPLRAKCVAFGADGKKSFVLANGAGPVFCEHHQLLHGRSRDNEQKTRVGYFGHLTTQWFDWGALFAAAREMPDTTFDIIGHGHVPRVVPENVRLLGAKSHDDIIPLAENWDVGIIPFTPGKLANAVDPIKIYEYFCLRLKVVSVFMEQIEGYPNTFLYEQSHEFLPTLRKALGADFDVESNSAFVDTASWSYRMGELETLIDGIKI